MSSNEPSGAAGATATKEAVGARSTAPPNPHNEDAVFIRDPAGNNLELKYQASTARPTLSTQPVTPAGHHSPTNPDTTEEHAS